MKSELHGIEVVETWRPTYGKVLGVYRDCSPSCMSGAGHGVDCSEEVDLDVSDDLECSTFTRVASSVALGSASGAEASCCVKIGAAISRSLGAAR